MNRLADETSPYLRQHRDNPVDWYPWGPEALAEAKRRNVPILLSVGYSACHWCHVMAHECFEDDEVAEAMNRQFVNVKVDREERPDVDAIYMEAVQAITGRGGWPMTVFIAPDGQPFYGGTYFPKPQFLELMTKISAIWTTEHDKAMAQAAQLTQAIGNTAGLRPAKDVPGAAELNAALQKVAESYDPEWGGFGRAPKFPQTMVLELCLRAYAASKGEGALKVVTTSLDAMASGGIYDHLGGGFARYSVDAFWMVPHFEKMLYDQALLAKVYLHAWQVTGAPHYRQVLDETIAYVLRDLRHPGGGFYSAEDADSEGEEGRFYVWRPEQIRDAIADPALAEAAIEWYGVSPQGNFEGSNILHRPIRGELARSPEIESARQLLLASRSQRVRPGLDDKVLAEWNALMLATLAEAAAATGNLEWMDAALANGEFLLRELRRPDGRWMRSWQADGGARHLALAADYACLVDAFTRLAEASGESRWMSAAIETADGLLDLFWDVDSGGVFTVGEDGEALVKRVKDVMDNATPSANSMAAVALQRLAALTGEARYAHQADRILQILADVSIKHPSAFAMALAAIDQRRTGATEIVIAGHRPDLLATVQQRYLPSAVLAWGERYESPLWDGRADDKAYVCRDFACQAPVDTPEALAAQLT